jgi:GTP-binding nuclear protein Ran
MNREPTTYLFKVVLLGDGRSGKTTWLRSVTTGEYTTTYTPTSNVDVHFLSHRTARGDTVNFSLWDTAGQEELSGLREGYYPGAHAALIFVDGSLPVYAQEVAYTRWYTLFERVCPDTPVVLVHTKADAYSFRVPPTRHAHPRLSISTRTYLATHAVLRTLARTLLRDPTVAFTDQVRPRYVTDWKDLLVERVTDALRDEHRQAEVVRVSE